ncbi:hypothetical protein BACCOPRO_01530 [Phocaeicola coprophilus DSM 18228 = JCM 13818]|uniref:Uncharacterized protein n=1 Tax=Phocaeicola coprophilus DSM 18228 = JCM 13818 TaxID=547042 RepID=S0F6S2_9BACT|nr:hypothetical protein BACCOPRO_01530 [Phocaeicola coprophilus DSM 18228 = JCM 13818]
MTDITELQQRLSLIRDGLCFFLQAPARFLSVPACRHIKAVRRS